MPPTCQLTGGDTVVVATPVSTVGTARPRRARKRAQPVPVDADLPPGETGFVLSSVEARTTEAEAQAQAMAQPMLPARSWQCPR